LQVERAKRGGEQAIKTICLEC